MVSHPGVLSDTEIRKEIEAGRIVMHSPDGDCSSQIQNCSVDVTLGEHFFRGSDDMGILNPFNVNHVHEYWDAPLKARNISEDDVINGNARKVGLKLNDRYIVIQPGETILGHTREFIGGRHHITTMLRARSSMGRANVTICRDAGWGDVGYINRWTLQITNNNKIPVVLPVGACVGQIIFFYTGVPSSEYNGSYQQAWDIKSLVFNWTPMDMLPRKNT
jgi:dCTP deaminase